MEVARWFGPLLPRRRREERLRILEASAALAEAIGQNTVPLEIVGEATYRHELLHLLQQRHFHLKVRVALAPEPFNPVDPFAVVATVKGRKVGYLSRAHAAAFHEVLRSGGFDPTTTFHALEAMILSRERTDGEHGPIGVVLRLPIKAALKMEKTR